MTPGRLKVLVTDMAWDAPTVEAAVLDGVGAVPVVAANAAEAELAREARDADAILTCFAQVSAPVIAAGRRLQVVSRYGVGTDNIAVDAATRRGILVTNVPTYCTDEVTEHALALLLTLARDVRTLDAAVRRGDWSPRIGTPIRRVAGRTLGIMGFGTIGRQLGRRAASLGLEVIAFDRRPERVAAEGFEPVQLNELAERGDFVSIHLPLTDETRHLVDASFLARMRSDAYLINCARGAIVDQLALAAALASGALAGAAMDCFEPEPLPLDHPLLAEPRFVASPHVAFLSRESVHELALRAAENVAAVLAGRRPASVVNPQLLQRPRWAHLRS